MASSKRPSSVRVRAYNVGFGDCFLLSFYYGSAAEQRHVLIDFGTTCRPANAPKDLFPKIAQDVKAECDKGSGVLHGLVVTHRHSDHLSAFGGDKVYDILKGLKPRVVVQPWTEDPSLPPDAPGPKKPLATSHAYARFLSDIELATHDLLLESSVCSTYGSAADRQQSFLGEEGVKCLGAIKNLQAIAPPENHVYTSYGMASGLEGLLPGVKISVLGPPTVEQYPELRKTLAETEAEYWKFCLSPMRGSGCDAQKVSPAGTRLNPPRYARWFIERAKKARASQIQALVRNLDSALNNTSVILLFEVGDKRLLFPGDAEVENWSYALFEARDKAVRRKQLAAVNLYKVGHHGSMNATPKTLWAGFKNRGDKKLFTALLSTKTGFFKGEHEVPRQKLVAELEKDSTFISTEDTPFGEIFRDITIEL